MRWKCSASLDLSPERFLERARHCAEGFQADLMLSGPGFAGEHRSRIGLFPAAELIILSDTQQSEIKDFCFQSSIPSLGWLSYELGLRLRGVSSVRPGPPGLPQGHLRQYGALIDYDARTGQCTVNAAGKTQLRDALDLAQAARQGTLLPKTAQPVDTKRCRPSGPAIPSLDREGYETGVRRTLEHIRDGQVYQLNLSIRFTQHAPDLDSHALFFDLLRGHPAPFYALFHGEGYRILSTSPERFLRVDHGQVLSQPIKGTRVVSGDEARSRAELLASAKEQAELSMIVDLIRNDISQHCDYGSVRVEHHRSIARVDDLLQMYTDVLGSLRQGSTCLDLLLDALPGGSVTGCPKHRALELIDELEPHSRGIYCGSFVHVAGERNLDSSICIRTAVHDISRNTFTFHAGSGIVVDSDPSGEYLETMAKAAKFLRGETT